MAKRVKNLFKKIGRAYIEGFSIMYGPSIKYGVNPFL